VLNKIYNTAREGGELTLHCKGGSSPWAPEGAIADIYRELERMPFPFEVTDDIEETRLNALTFYGENSILLSATVVQMIAAASWTGRVCSSNLEAGAMTKEFVALSYHGEANVKARVADGTDEEISDQQRRLICKILTRSCMCEVPLNLSTMHIADVPQEISICIGQLMTQAEDKVTTTPKETIRTELNRILLSSFPKNAPAAARYSKALVAAGMASVITVAEATPSEAVHAEGIQASIMAHTVVIANCFHLQLHLRAGASLLSHSSPRFQEAQRSTKRR
jgi:hypothetical protein